MTGSAAWGLTPATLGSDVLDPSRHRSSDSSERAPLAAITTSMWPSGEKLIAWDPTGFDQPHGAARPPAGRVVKANDSRRVAQRDQSSVRAELAARETADWEARSRRTKRGVLLKLREQIRARLDTILQLHPGDREQHRAIEVRFGQRLRTESLGVGGERLALRVPSLDQCDHAGERPRRAGARRRQPVARAGDGWLAAGRGAPGLPPRGSCRGSCARRR